MERGGGGGGGQRGGGGGGGRIQCAVRVCKNKVYSPPKLIWNWNRAKSCSSVVLISFISFPNLDLLYVLCGTGVTAKCTVMAGACRPAAIAGTSIPVLIPRSGTVDKIYGVLSSNRLQWLDFNWYNPWLVVPVMAARMSCLIGRNHPPFCHKNGVCILWLWVTGSSADNGMCAKDYFSLHVLAVGMGLLADT